MLFRFQRCVHFCGPQFETIARAFSLPPPLVDAVQFLAYSKLISTTLGNSISYFTGS
jgi:hypothetical protein